MFSAMILACAIGPDGSISRQNCRGFSSPYLWEDVDQCAQALTVGMAAVEEQGWTIMSYDCYEWKKKKGDT